MCCPFYRILLALGANESWTVHQTDVVQAFLHGILDDADLYVQPPVRFPCPPGFVCKLRRAIYGLHQAPVKFKYEVVAWFKQNNYTSANSSETIWIRREGTSVLIHGLYAVDFLHHTNDPNMYKVFQQKFTKRFEVKSGKAAVFLGNRITVDSNKLTMNIDQTQYIDELLERFHMTDCNPVSTPMLQRLSAKHGGVTGRTTRPIKAWVTQTAIFRQGKNYLENYYELRFYDYFKRKKTP